MNKRRLIFLSVFGAYQLCIFIFALFVENSDPGTLFSIFGKIYLIKWGAFVGIAMLAAEFVWTWMDAKNAAKEKEAMRHENNVLKAKVYDLSNGSTNSSNQ
jgi:hypothetical protein